MYRTDTHKKLLPTKKLRPLARPSFRFAYDGAVEH
jgi:hypothetical protein